LLKVRESVWHAWFVNDAKALERLVPPGTIVISSGEEKWKGQADILQSAAQFQASGGKLVRLAGLQTVGWLCGKIKAESTTKTAALRGVEVVPLSAYHHGRMAREGLQLGFAAVDAKEIRRGAHELAIALETESKALRKRT
jgi:DNA-binding transcriptional MocR family regulator